MPSRWNLRILLFSAVILIASIKPIYVLYHLVQGRAAPPMKLAIDYFSLAPMLFDSDKFFYAHQFDLKFGRKSVTLQGRDIFSKFENYSERAMFNHVFYAPSRIREPMFSKFICEKYRLFAGISPPFTATWKVVPRLALKASAEPQLVTSTTCKN